MMTRTIEERLDKLEANQFEIKKLLKEITSTLIVILKTIEKLPLIGDAPEDATRNEQPVNSLPAAKGTVQLPPFSGADPIGWVAHANQQFELHDVSHEVKVQAAVVAMEEAALFWVIWLRSRNLVITWEEFSQALVAHFDTRFKGSSFEHLADVKQSGLDLKVSIRSSMCLMRPSDLETAMKFSKDVEDNYSMQAGGCLFRGFNSPVQRSNSFSRPGAAASGKHGSSASNFQKPLDRPPDPRSRFTNLDNYSMQAGGCLFVMLAAVMSGFRWTMTQILLQKEAYGLKNPLTLMSYVTPIMAIATGLLSLMLDPWHEFRKSDYFNSSSHMLRSSLLMLFGGTLAFFMVLTEYILVSVTSAVTVTIAGVVKEAVTILVAVLYFHDEFTWLKGLGLLTIMAGVSLFNWYKYDKLQKGETIVELSTDNTTTSKYAILDEMDEEEDIPLNPNQ